MLHCCPLPVLTFILHTANAGWLTSRSCDAGIGPVASEQFYQYQYIHMESSRYASRHRCISKILYKNDPRNWSENEGKSSKSLKKMLLKRTSHHLLPKTSTDINIFSFMIIKTVLQSFSSEAFADSRVFFTLEVICSGRDWQPPYL